MMSHLVFGFPVNCPSCLEFFTEREVACFCICFWHCMRQKVEMELNFRENERVCDPETQTREVNYMHCTPIIIFTILPVLFNQVGSTSVPDMRPAGLHKFDQVCVRLLHFSCCRVREYVCVLGTQTWDVNEHFKGNQRVFCTQLRWVLNPQQIKSKCRLESGWTI